MRGTQLPLLWYSVLSMRPRLSRFTTLILALLSAVASCIPLPGLAEAQMRCPGASLRSVPCARAELPAAGLTERQVYGRLMSCCRSMRGGCAMMQDCPMRQSSRNTASHRSALSARRCLVSIRISTAPKTLVAIRTRWLLATAPALAPPVTAQALALPARASRRALWTYSPVLSPHAAPHLHGLRAPPIA